MQQKSGMGQLNVRHILNTSLAEKSIADLCLAWGSDEDDDGRED